jgi:hypothetical protein
MREKVIMRLILAAFLLAAICCQAYAQNVTNGSVTLQAVQKGKEYTGFDIKSGDQIAAQIRFCSGDLITARTCTVRKTVPGLQFSGLHVRAGAVLAKESSVTISLKPGDSYPRLAFDLRLISFNPKTWQKVAGISPFHFLALHIEHAEAWQTRGWLNATPYADPFPLLLDKHKGTPEISAFPYNRQWSYTPPLDADPLPVIGLWSPAHHQYASMEFLTTRLEDNSEKDIATGYCWNAGVSTSTAKAAPKTAVTHNFVTLVYPYGGQGYQQLVYPTVPVTIASHCRILWNTELQSIQDPNEFVYSVLFPQIKNRLPRVPASVDLSWLPGGIRLPDFPGPAQNPLIDGSNPTFQAPGTTSIGGWAWYNENPVTMARVTGNTKRLAQLEAEAQELLPLAKKFTVAGDDCVYWELPLQGHWVDDWGGAPVTTLHNTTGFAAARVFLALYRDLGDTEYLPIIDGALNWAKHIAWTRNEFADVPSSPFAIGGTLSASFCLDYYFTFRSAKDQHHINEAQQALELARTFAYRYLSMWPCDNNRDDNLQSSFLWEPNSGRDWTGAACANEVFWNLDTLAQTAVETGDPVLLWALQGSLDSWSRLYQNRFHPSLSDYAASDMGEGYGLAPGDVYGVGMHSAYGFAQPLMMIEPVGNSSVRVLAGDKSALAFCKNGARITVNDYRCSSPGDFEFRVNGNRAHFDLSLTCPYVDLSGKSVGLVRDGKTSDLTPGVDYIRPPQAIWSLYIKGLQPDDKIIVGSPDENSPILNSLPPLTDDTSPELPTGYTPLNLTMNVKLDRDWSRLDSFAGLPHSMLWAYGAPFLIASQGTDNALTGEGIQLPDAVKGAAALAVLYTNSAGSAPSIVFSDNSTAPLDSSLTSMAWRSWPPIYTSKLMMSIVLCSGKDAVKINTGAAAVLAVTAIAQNHLDEVSASLSDGHAEWLKILSDQKIVQSVSRLTAGVTAGSIAIIPPLPSGPAINMMDESGLASKTVTLSNNEYVDQSIFNAKRFPLAIYAGGEDYVQTVKQEGDGVKSILDYLNGGGTLALLSNQPLPFCYAMSGGAKKSDPLDARMGIPIYNSNEGVPPEKLTVVMANGQQLLTGIPAQMPFPHQDPRLRSIDPSKIPAGSNYQPIYHVVGASGKSYGDAAGLVTLPSGGKILYIWSGLLNDPDQGSSISSAALRYLISTYHP